MFGFSNTNLLQAGNSQLMAQERTREKEGAPPTAKIFPASYMTALPFIAVGPRLPAGVVVPAPVRSVNQFICVLGPAWNTAAALSEAQRVATGASSNA
jgi:hypothetical protein